jgi:hypothetical protein
MNTGYQALYEILSKGFEALLRELGPAEAIRFIQQYEIGQGDYYRDRYNRTRLAHFSVPKTTDLALLKGVSGTSAFNFGHFPR